MKTEDRYYSDKEVKAFLHNLAISVVRWDKFKDQPPSFFSAARNLAGGLVLELRDVFSHDDAGKEIEQMITDEALSLSLIAAAHILLNSSTDTVSDEEVEAETKSLAKKKLVRTK